MPKNIYNSWGFTANPFLQTSLEADETGARLLIGRTVELGKLENALVTPPRIPTLEGINGVGKTSLANVATYNLYRQFVNGDLADVFLPCRKRFQISPATDTEEFINDIFTYVAKTIIEFKTSVIDQSHGLENFREVEKWLTSPLSKSMQGSLSIPSIGGISGGGGAAFNTGMGFSRTGFRSQVKEWLAQMFTQEGKGGVVCIIDNLELLETSEALRRCIEALRDEVLTVPGIRPILCGANGIVLSILSSPRLAGILQRPVEVRPLSLDRSHEILESRIQAFQLVPNGGYLPITAQSFLMLYEWLGRNLRSLLQYADDYCSYVADSGNDPKSDEEKTELFLEWFDNIAGEVYKACDTRLTQRAWKLLSDLIAQGGVASPSDYSDFDFNSLEAMRPYSKALEDTNLVVTTREEADKRRKSLSVTANGYLADHYQKKEMQKWRDI